MPETSAPRNPEALNNAVNGCLGCDREAVLAVLREAGIDLDRFSEVPWPRHAWPDIVPCYRCGRAWLCAPPIAAQR